MLRLLLSTILATLAVRVAAQCNVTALKTATDHLLMAQTAGRPTMPSWDASTVVYTENRKAANFSKSIITTALTVAHNRSQHDAEQCATYSEFIVTDASKPHVLAFQMRLDNTTNKVTKIDSIVTGKGDWLFNVTGTYYWASRENWGPIPAEKRDTRAVIQHAADAYLDVFNDKSVVVPWGTPCARLEGGAYTGSGKPTDSCNVGVPSGVKNINRQYVVDVEYGTVDVMFDFATALADSHEFRIESGKLRFVHTLTSCGTSNCAGM